MNYLQSHREEKYELCLLHGRQPQLRRHLMIDYSLIVRKNFQQKSYEQKQILNILETQNKLKVAEMPRRNKSYRPTFSVNLKSFHLPSVK